MRPARGIAAAQKKSADEVCLIHERPLTTGVGPRLAPSWGDPFNHRQWTFRLSRAKPSSFASRPF